jgi:hypothetical protein
MSPSIIMTPASLLPSIAAIALVLATGCGGHPDRAVRHYVEHAPRAPAATAPVSSVAVAAPTPTPATSAALRWTTPPGWVEESASGMRLASFRVESGGVTGLCTIVQLAGDGGGLEANIRRWMGQLKLPVPPDAELRAFAERQETLRTRGGFTGRVVDLAPLGPPEAPSMLALFLDAGERTVFVKFTAPAAWLAEHRAEFTALCESLENTP